MADLDRMRAPRNVRPLPVSVPRRSTRLESLRPVGATVSARTEPSSSKRTAAALWSWIPHDIADGFRPYADQMAKAILREIQAAVPEYAQPLQGSFGYVITRGVRQAILPFVDTTDAPTVSKDTWARVFRDLGKVEFKEGRGLDCLQTAYRVGGRVAWRHVSEFGQAAGLDADALCLAAEAIFAYVDEISALSTEGYAEAQIRAVGSLARHRRRLLELILATPPVPLEAIAAQAAVAQWPLPADIAVVALETRSERHDLPMPDLHGDVLMNLEGAERYLVIGDPACHLKDIEGRLEGWRAAVGPTVSLTDATQSLSWAQRALRLAQRGVVADGPIIRCANHLSTLWLFTDELLVKEIIARALKPFDTLTVKQRARLSETLLVWLQSSGSSPEMAKILGIHPQTVRYRMHQIVELFGDSLRDADARLDLEIALRAEALLSED